MSSLGQDAERFFTSDIAPDPIIGQLQLSLPRNSPQYDVTFKGFCVVQFTAREANEPTRHFLCPGKWPLAQLIRCAFTGLIQNQPSC